MTHQYTQRSSARQTPRKRIVLCCDGTWDKPDAANITNVEKVARSIQTDLDRTAGIQQLVGYVPGVGTGYGMDRILGGAFGYGLFNNVRTAYRFLALNFRAGDEIFAFGFSRGAYTARSLAGMLGTIGLLTRDGLVDGHLHEALERYRLAPDIPKPPKGEDPYVSLEDFQTRWCHRTDTAKVTFLGVFDTVGALGVPGILHPRHQFHNVSLGDGVTTARQALAIDERRRRFEPCLWKVPDDNNEVSKEHVRVKQVWFEGVHSDVGGGYSQRGLSITTLKWMSDEATQAGLIFDHALLGRYLSDDTPACRHDSLTFAYRLLNARESLKARLKGRRGYFVHGRRNLEPPVTEQDRNLPRPLSLPVMLSSTASEDYHAGYRPGNLKRYIKQHGGTLDQTHIQKVTRLPKGSPIPTPNYRVT